MSKVGLWNGIMNYLCLFRGYNQGASSGQPPGTPGQDPYNRYQPPGYQPRPGYPAHPGQGHPGPGHPGQAPPSSPGAGQQPGQPQDFYRSDQVGRPWVDAVQRSMGVE